MLFFADYNNAIKQKPGKFTILDTMKKLLVIIPSRFHSSRFEGKPLTIIKGKTMLERVWLQCQKLNEILTDYEVEVIIATDHPSIAQECEHIGARYYLTQSNHQSGTDRCFEAIKKHNTDVDLMLNVQGDEPFINPNALAQLIRFLDASQYPLATLCRAIGAQENLADPNCVKVVKSIHHQALYFSRAPIPFYREDPIGSTQKHYQHIGVYAFKKKVFRFLPNLKVSPLEKAEQLEQLRWLEAGYTIGVLETHYQSCAVDTPEDLMSVEKFLKQNPEWE